MRQDVLWNGFDGVAGAASAWFSISGWQRPSLHVWGLHAADEVKVWANGADPKPTTDVLTSASGATLVDFTHVAGEGIVLALEEFQGYVCVELDVKGGSVTTRKAHLRGETPG